MEDFIIATASTCDADREWLEENNIPMISYTFEVNEKVYIDMHSSMKCVKGISQKHLRLLRMLIMNSLKNY